MNRSAKVLGALLALYLVVVFSVPSHAEQVRRRARCWYASAASNADILSSGDIGVSAAGKSVAFRITVALVSTASVFNAVLTRTNSDGNEESQTFGLNSSSALSAGDMFTFTLGLEDRIDDADDAQLGLNFQCETATTVGYLSVQEVTPE